MPLVNTSKMFKKAYERRYAVGAFTFNDIEIFRGIISAAIEENAPIILQVPPSTLHYAHQFDLSKLIETSVETCPLPIALHLDHCNSFEVCKTAIDKGFTSVMIDCSHCSFEENIAITSQVVKYAHDRDVSVEAELSGSIEGDTREDSLEAAFTDLDQVEEFVSRTGVDSLALAIGTSHGAYKFNDEAHLRFDILSDVEERMPGFPLVLHGASSIPYEYVAAIQNNGGIIPEIKGVPEEILRRAASMAICKINIESDLRIAFTAGLRMHLSENPTHYDPRQYLFSARELVKKCVRHKIVHILGCNNEA